MLPLIEAQARLAFRHLDPESKQEAVQEVTANALCAFARLAQLDKLDLAYPSVLTAYGIRQYHDGRRVGNRLNIKDVMSPYARKRKSITVESLDKYDADESCWQEILVPDHHCTPAELAATRIDFPAWLATLTPRDRRIALKLAGGDRTGEVAQRFTLSEGRVSQLRRELADSWRKFVGETDVNVAG